jgi:hypothetical protein
LQPVATGLKKPAIVNGVDLDEIGIRRAAARDSPKSRQRRGGA